VKVYKIALVSSGGEKQGLRIPSPRELTAIIIVVVLVLGAALAGSLALTRDVFSATGFVASYMDALIRRDAASALSMPGVISGNRTDVLGDPEAVLLTQAALPDQNARATYTILSDDVLPGASGIHRVRVSTSLAEDDIVFEVAQTSSIAGLFGQWEFTTSPLAYVNVTTEHATYFSVNGFGPVDVVSVDPSLSAEDFGAIHAFPVLAPSAYAFSITSRSLTSPVETVSVIPGERSEVTVVASPTPNFVSRVQKEVDSYFAACAAQRVLLPSGCLFGIGIENRVVGEPTWAVVTNPVVALVPGEAGWEISPAEMKLSFAAEIQSLFDGSIAPVTEEITLTIGGTVGLSASGDIAVLIRRLE
jgi:hypothetical protein